MKRARLTTALLALCLSMTTGCLFRTHRVERKRSPVPLKSATQSELVAKLNQLAGSIQTMNATVEIDTTVGGEKAGKVTEYQEISGYILLQRPKMLRMIGLLPVVHSRAFDMVSNGERFQLSIPPKDRYITGSDQLTKISNNPLENLRPQAIYEAILMPTIDPANDIAVLEDGTQRVVDDKTHQTIAQPDYHILVIRRDAQNSWRLHSKIFFSRADLMPYRQAIYDDSGAVATDVTYSSLQDYNGVSYPSQIEINRPREEYNLVLKFIKLTLNEPLKTDQFQLEVPPGATVTELK